MDHADLQSTLQCTLGQPLSHTYGVYGTAMLSPLHLNSLRKSTTE